MIIGNKIILIFKKFLFLLIVCFFSINIPVYASPEEDLDEIREYFNNRLKVFFLSDPYIYLYNNSNNYSISKYIVLHDASWL